MAKRALQAGLYAIRANIVNIGSEIRQLKSRIRELELEKENLQEVYNALCDAKGYCKKCVGAGEVFVPGEGLHPCDGCATAKLK